MIIKIDVFIFTGSHYYKVEENNSGFREKIPISSINENLQRVDAAVAFNANEIYLFSGNEVFITSLDSRNSRIEV